MEQMDELYMLLCSGGFLPPRNEEELIETEKRMAAFQFKNTDRHVDTQAIINGMSCEVAGINMFDEGIDEGSLGMAARNFDRLPKSIIDKIRSKHKKDDKGAK